VLVKVIYLFAGKRRQSDVSTCLKKLQDAGKIQLQLLEFDIARSESHDLRSKELWEQICEKLKEGGWFLIVSPPCNTFSRAQARGLSEVALGQRVFLGFQMLTRRLSMRPTSLSCSALVPVTLLCSIAVGFCLSTLRI
jgi:hypothetical protein